VIATNLHVIQGETSVVVKLANGDVYDDVSVVEVDARKDIVLIKIKAFGLHTARLEDSDRVRVGDTVVLIGSPQGFDQSVSTGIVSAIRDSGDGYRMFQTDAAASPGSSGGGMFNDTGELVGIVTAELTNAENVNFALPINYARGLIGTDAQMTLQDLAELYPRSDSIPEAVHATATEAQSALGLRRLLDESGLEYEEVAESLWSVSYGGSSLSRVEVYLSPYGDLILTQAFLVDPPTLTMHQMDRLLRMNYEIDLAKIAIDGDGDLAVLNETEVAALNGLGLARVVNSVARITDELAGLLADGSTLTVHEVQPETARPLLGLEEPDFDTLSLLGGKAVLRFDPSEWQLVREPDEPGHQQLVHVDGDVYFRVITERIAVPMGALPEVMLANAKAASDDVRITRQAMRSVNGTDVLLLELTGTVTGIPFVFYGHYYTGPQGTIQLTGFTSENLIDEYRVSIEKLVSGFDLTE
jgi:hypothetical protein